MAKDDQNIKITFDTNAQSAANDANKLAGSLDKVEQSGQEANKSMKNLDATFEEVYGDLQPLTTRMGEAEDRLYELALAGQTASQEYQDLLRKVAEYRKTQIETDRVVDAAATTLGQKLGGAAQIAATGVQGVTAGMALFGNQSEETEKALLKVQAAMAFADAISNVSTLGGQWKILKSSILESSIATKANTAATGAAAIVQNLFTGSVNTTSAGFKTLKLAIAGTGIGLLVVGLAAVVTNFEKISKWTTNLIPGLSSVGRFIGKIVESVTDFIGVTSEADRVASRLKSNAEKRSKEIDRILKEDGSRYSESAKKKMAIDKQLQDDIASGLYNEQKLRKEAAFAKAEIDRVNRENEIKKAKEHADRLADEAKKAQDKANEEAKKRREEQRQKEKEDAELAKKDREEDAAALLDFQAKLAMSEQENRVEARNQEEQNLKDFNARIEEETTRTSESINTTREKNVEAKQAEDNALKDLGNQGIAAAKDLFAKNKAIQKGIIVAESGVALGKLAVNTVEAVGKDNAASPLTFGMPWSGIHIAQGALGAATIIANTSKQLQALGGGGSGGVSSSGSGVTNQARSAAPPSVAFNNSAENQIGQSVARTQAEQPPLKVTVLESDITKAQNNVNVLVKKNEF